MRTKQTTKIESFIASLRTASQGMACEMADRCLREERFHDMLELWRAVNAACQHEGRERFPYPQVADYIEDLLATHAGPADILFTLLAELPGKTVVQAGPRPYRVRGIASRLGFGQTKETLLAALARFAADDAHRELLACWTQEAVIRGRSLERDDIAQAFRATLAALHHPLAYLPLAPLDIERQAPTIPPIYGGGIRQCSPARVRPSAPPRAPALLPRATRLEAHDAERRFEAAVRPWTDGSGASIEAKLFRIEPSIAGIAPGRWLLRALPLDCLAGAESIQMDQADAEAAWSDLFSAATGGGAYSSGLGGAYGRVAAWTSLGALVDAPADGAPSAIEARAHDCSFLMFKASNKWFHDVAWDLGILAVRAGGETVAVLAASDTD